MKKMILALLLPSLWLYASCKKDELDRDCLPDLPCASQYGANTFGCYINGKPWVAHIAHYILDPTLTRPVDAIYDEQGYRLDKTNLFHIKARKVDSTGYDFWSINITPLPDTLTINQQTPKVFDRLKVEANLPNVYGESKRFIIDTLSDHRISITKIDTKKMVIAATFDFRMISKDYKDTIYISKGRFDVKYLAE